MLRRYAAAFLAASIALLFTGGMFDQLADRTLGEASRLKAESDITQQKQAEIERLDVEQREYEGQLSLLYGLRAGAAIEDIFSIVDRSFAAGELWFLDWSFQRAGIIVDGEKRGIETGYFIIVSEDGEPASGQDLEVETRMTIRGQAQNHQSLSKFVRALFEQRDIRDVSVQKTSQADYASRRVVDFAITIVLNSALGES